METSSSDALWQLVFMFIFVVLIGYLLTPLPAYISHQVARSKGMEALPFAFFAYWILMFPAMWGISAGITPQ